MGALSGCGGTYFGLSGCVVDIRQRTYTVLDSYGANYTNLCPGIKFSCFTFPSATSSPQFTKSPFKGAISDWAGANRIGKYWVGTDFSKSERERKTASGFRDYSNCVFYGTSHSNGWVIYILITIWFHVGCRIRSCRRDRADSQVARAIKLQIVDSNFTDIGFARLEWG